MVDKNESGWASRKKAEEPFGNDLIRTIASALEQQTESASASSVNLCLQSPDGFTQVQIMIPSGEATGAEAPGLLVVSEILDQLDDEHTCGRVSAIFMNDGSPGEHNYAEFDFLINSRRERARFPGREIDQDILGTRLERLSKPQSSRLCALIAECTIN